MKNYKKYSYLGYTYPGVSRHWKPIIEEMLVKIDKLARPWYIPLFIANIINKWATGGSVVRVENWFWYNFFNRFITRIKIMDIKDKYAQLRVYGSFTDEIYSIIGWAEKECELTCENCGSRADVKFCGDRWVYNFCMDCRVKNGLEEYIIT